MDHSAFLDGPADHSAFLDAPAALSAVPSIFHRALNFAEREGPPIAGGLIGGVLGAPGGPAGVIGGAALGGAAGRAIGRDVEYVTGSRDPLKDTALGNAGDISRAGLGQAAAATAGLQTEAVLKALAPPATKIAAGGLKVMAAIPEKSGEAALRDPAILNRGLLPAQRGAPYEAFERYTGLKGLGTQIENGELKAGDTSNAAYFDHAIDVANRVKAGAPIVDATGKVVTAGKASYSGEPLTTQDLYSASQKASNLKLGPFENPGMQKAIKSGVLDRAKDTADTALGKIYEEYSGLRKGNFESHVREDFGTLLPKNKNGTANVLRPVAAIGAAMGGNPEALAFTSPAVWGGMIRGAHAAAPAISGATSLAARAEAANLAGQEASAAPTPSASMVQSPGLIANILRSNNLNPAKSGQWGKEISGLGLPTDMVSGSGKTSITQLARLLHDAGAISENDEGEAVQYLKSIAGKVGK